MIKTTTNRFIPQIVILGRFIDQFCSLNFQVLSCIPCYVELSIHVNISHKNAVAIDEYVLSAFLPCDLTKLKNDILKAHPGFYVVSFLVCLHCFPIFYVEEKIVTVSYVTVLAGGVEKTLSTFTNIFEKTRDDKEYA